MKYKQFIILGNHFRSNQIVLVVTVAVDFNVIFTRFSQESMWKLTLYCFNMPTPACALQALCEAVAIKPDNYVCFLIRRFRKLEM